MTDNILGIKINVVSMKKATNTLKTFLKTNELDMVVTPNPEIVMRSRKDKELLNIINNASLTVPDGIGIVIASRKIKERVAGIDLIKNFFQSLDKNITVYLVGGREGVAKKAARNLTKKYRNIEIVGTHNGFFSNDKKEEMVLLKDINEKKPDILLVGTGSPSQEKWIWRNKPKAKIAIGCGGSLDVFAGNTARAPEIFIKMNLEWLYRAIKEPVRFKRLAVMPVFLYLVILRRFKNVIFK